MKKTKKYIIATNNGDARKVFTNKKEARAYYATLDSTEYIFYTIKE